MKSSFTSMPASSISSPRTTPRSPPLSPLPPLLRPPSSLPSQLQLRGSEWSCAFSLDSEGKHIVQVMMKEDPTDKSPGAPSQSQSQSQSQAQGQAPGASSQAEGRRSRASGGGGSSSSSNASRRVRILADVVHGGPSCHFHVVLRRAPPHGPYM